MLDGALATVDAASETCASGPGVGKGWGLSTRLSTISMMTERMIIPRTVLLLVGVLALIAMIGCVGQTAPGQVEKAVVAVFPLPGSAPIYVAHSKGYFRDEGLDVTLDYYAAANRGLQAALTGEADFATSADTPIVRAALNGAPVAVIATISQIDRGVRIIARRDAGIASPDDLKGKRIGMVAGTTTEFFLHMYLATRYISLSDVQLVNLSAEAFNDALLNGEVDAVSANAPYSIVLRDKLGSNAITFDDPGHPVKTWNVSVRQESARNNPERIEKFLRAVLRAERFIRQHPDEARAISAGYIGTDSSLYEREWQDYHFTTTLDQSLILNLEGQARWMLRSKGDSASEVPYFLDLIYPNALRAVAPGAVRIPGR